MIWARAFLIWLVLALPATAQGAGPSVLVIDSERLFFETAYGQRLTEELAAQAAALQAENDEIVATLTEEERSLTLRRPQMSPEDFRVEADAFDAKVQEVRRARDAKNVELQLANAAVRGQFEDRVQDIIVAVMIERGASVVLEQRSVLLSVRGVNITETVIARIDSTLGDGQP